MMMLELNDAYSEFLQQLNECIYIMAAREKLYFRHQKIIREAWITKGILISSRILGKLYI